MINRLVIENLGPIAKVEVPLGRFTVLVGPNDAGKSTILKGMSLLADAASFPPLETLPHQFNSPLRIPYSILVRDADEKRRIRVRVEGATSSARFGYELEFRDRDGFSSIAREELTWNDRSLFSSASHHTDRSRGVSQLEQLWGHTVPFLAQPNASIAPDERRAITAELGWASLVPDPRRLALPCPTKVDPNHLEEDGFGLAAVVDQILTGTDRDAIVDIERELRAFSPFVSKIGTRRTESGDGKEIIVSLANGTVLRANQLSSGLLLALAFLVLRHLKKRKFLIEEPENGIHPRKLREVVDALRKTAHLPDGQVIATTHSPLLLNHVEPEEAVVITRNADGVKATPMVETKFFKERNEDYALGELWYNVGERELVPEAS